MTLIINSLYLIILLIYFFLAFFILYHLVRYSINPVMKLFSLVFFSVVSAGLLLANISLFFSIDWNRIVSNLSF